MVAGSGRRHTTLPYTRARRAAQDLAVVQRRHVIHALIEADVTRTRAALGAYEHATGERLSFTAFVIACVARAVDEQKTVQAYRRGRRHVIVFDDVDVTTMIAREVAGQQQVAFHIVRAANTKSVLDIHRELRAAQRRRQRRLAERAQLSIYDALPGPLRRALLRIGAHFPSVWKQFGGTVAVTAVGMFGAGGGWGIPITCNTLDVTVGGIGLKPGLVDGQVAPREFLGLTITADHDVVDGAPAARFASRLREIVEGGDCLAVLAGTPGVAAEVGGATARTPARRTTSPA